MPDSGEEVLVFANVQARELAGVSRRRQRYWEEVGLVVPSLKRRLGIHRTARFYSYQDLLVLLTVSELRTERGVSLQKIRGIARHLRSRGYQAPLRELRFATLGREVYVQHPDGGWEGGPQPDQMVFAGMLPLEPLRLRVDKAARRPAGPAAWAEGRSDQARRQLAAAS